MMVRTFPLDETEPLLNPLCLLLHVAVALIVLGSARGSLAQPNELDSFVWQGRALAVPIMVEADSLVQDGAVYAVDYVLVGSDGERFIPFPSGAGFSSATTSANGWVTISLGCGTACTASVIVDPATGKVSNTINLLATIDHERGLAAALDEAGIVVFDPFGSYVEVPLDRSEHADRSFSEWVGQIGDVSFVTDQDALYVIKRMPDDREEPVVIPFNVPRER